MKEKKVKNKTETILKDNKKDINGTNVKFVVVCVVFVLIVLYLGYSVYLLLIHPTDKVTVEKATLYLEESDVGYIIRNEQIVKGNNYKNGMEQIKNEGEKTAKGDSIYRYYSQNEESLKKQIYELDIQIQEALKGKNDLFTSDTKLIEKQIDENMQYINRLTDISKIEEYKKIINNLVAKKAKISGESSNAGAYLKQLYSQRAQLESQLNSGAEYITAPVSGIVSYKVDGLEEQLTPNNFSTFNKQYLENLNLKTGQLIATNTECGKIIDSSKCYIATISNSEEAKSAEVNDKIKIRLSNNKIIDAQIVYKSVENEQETLIILEVKKEINELANYRKIFFEIIWWSGTGLKVPNQAIVEKDGLNYVVRNRAGYLSEILIKVNRNNDKYSIVSNYSTQELSDLGFSTIEISNMKKISIYDELLLNPELNK